MRMIGERLRSSGNPTSGSGVYEEHGLFLFPNTDAGWLATVGRLWTDSTKHAQAVHSLVRSYTIGTQAHQLRFDQSAFC